MSAPSSRVNERSAPARSAPTREVLCSEAERSRAPAKKTSEKSRKSRAQCSKMAPGACISANFALRSVARERSVPESVARERSARVRSARLRSLPEMSLPVRSAPVRSGVTFGFFARQSFHSGVRRIRKCSGLAICGHCNRPGAEGALQSLAVSTATTTPIAAPTKAMDRIRKALLGGHPLHLRPDVGGGASRAPRAAPREDVLRRARVLRRVVGRGRTRRRRKPGARTRRIP